MAHRSGRNAEPYTAFIPHENISYFNPRTIFYTTRSGLECRRYFCAVCGELHPANVHHGERTMEWVTGTTMPDALHRATEAKVMDDMVQGRYQRGSSLPDYLAIRKEQSKPSYIDHKKCSK